jgi:hypothetical protein
MKPLVDGAAGGPTGPRGRKDDESVGRVGGVFGGGGASGADGGSGCWGWDQTERPAAKWSLSTTASASAYRTPVR